MVRRDNVTMKGNVWKVGKWSNPEEWERLRNAESCPVCLRGRPSDIIAELEGILPHWRREFPMKVRGFAA